MEERAGLWSEGELASEWIGGSRDSLYRSWRSSGNVFGVAWYYNDAAPWPGLRRTERVRTTGGEARGGCGASGPGEMNLHPDRRG